MSAQIHKMKFDGLTEEVITFVHLGLLEFCRQSLPADSHVIVLLESSPSIVNTKSNLSWQSSCDYLQKTIKKSNRLSPMANLCFDYKLSLSQLFTIGLVGEIEASHIVNLVIAELQQPDKNPRPSLHLLSAMLGSLFDDPHVAVFDIAQQPLVEENVLQLEGDGPLPFKRLTIEAALWSILCARKTAWPQCRLIQSSQQDVSNNEVEKIASLVNIVNTKGDLSGARGVVVRGSPNSGRVNFSASLAKSLGLSPVLVPYELWRDHPVISVACRYANWLPVIQVNVAPGESLRLPQNLQQVPLAVLMSADGAIETNNFIEINLSLPEQLERQKAWNNVLNDEHLSEILAASALLSSITIERIATQAKRIAQQKNEELRLSHISDARYKLGTEKLRLLAQPVHRKVTGEALVMPELVEKGLNSVVLRANKRESIWEGMGVTLKATPNPGVRALFVGDSGTGKTLAASYIATQLSTPLYRVDLSAIMNKYIGESEKNLAQLLDQAAANDVVLLVDEADALFGNRSGGKETGERFANMLTNFLLTRIETHPGIVILTTNSRERIDSAFNRRIDAVIEFPLPGYEERLHLWQSHLGERGPGDDFYKTLASYCNLSGGQIRNVALSAAVYSSGNRISRDNLLIGLNLEYQKLGQALPKKIL